MGALCYIISVKVVQMIITRQISIDLSDNNTAPIIRLQQSCIGVNIEFFSKEKGEFATAARIAKQREIANRYADIILSFSYSDYYAPKIVKNT